MMRCFRKRDRADKKHDRVLSRYWSELGRRHEDEMKKLNFRASTLIFEGEWHAQGCKVYNGYAPFCGASTANNAVRTYCSLMPQD